MSHARSLCCNTWNPISTKVVFPVSGWLVSYSVAAGLPTGSTFKGTNLWVIFGSSINHTNSLEAPSPHSGLQDVSNFSCRHMHAVRLKNLKPNVALITILAFQANTKMSQGSSSGSPQGSASNRRKEVYQVSPRSRNLLLANVKYFVFVPCPCCAKATTFTLPHCSLSFRSYDYFDTTRNVSNLVTLWTRFHSSSRCPKWTLNQHSL